MDAVSSASAVPSTTGTGQTNDQQALEIMVKTFLESMTAQIMGDLQEAQQKADERRAQLKQDSKQ